MSFTFDATQAFDPTDPRIVAANAEIIFHAVGDTSLTPLEITDVTGVPLPNPYTTNDLGAMPAFVHEALDQVAWSGGGQSGKLTSWEGLRGAAEEARDAAGASRVAAESAAIGAVAAVEGSLSAYTDAVNTSRDAALAAETAAVDAANLVGAPADTAIATAINGPGTQTQTALSNAIDEGLQGFGASDAVQPFLSIIENGVRDAHALLIADSTSNDPAEWAYLFFADLAARYPTRTFEYRLWNDATQTYNAPVVFGSGARKVTLWNASIAGATTQSWQAARITPAVYSVPADVILISLGHNEGADTHAYTWRPRYLSLTESISAKMPGAAIVLIGQNPATANTFQASRLEVYKQIAARQGYGFIDAHAAFIKAGGDLTVDGIHPNPAGSRLWADVVLGAFTRTKAAPRTRQASMLKQRTVENKMPNGDLSAWTGTTPTGWLVTRATSVKETTGMESGVSAVTWNVTGDAAVAYYNLPAGTLAGKTFTLAVRAKVHAGSTRDTGRIGTYDDVASSTLQPLGSDPTDGYRWILHEGKFAANALTPRVYIYLGNIGSSITVDRIILVEGGEPSDAATLAIASGGGGAVEKVDWGTPAGLAPTAGVTVGSLRIKREGSMVFCQVLNMVIPPDSVAFKVATVPTGFRSNAGPAGAVSSAWALLTAAGGSNPRYQQFMSVNNDAIRWNGAQDLGTGAALGAPTRIDGVLIWHTQDPMPV